MSAQWFDLGLRLHAAHTGRPAPRLTGSPITTPHEPLAIRATLTKGIPTLTLANRQGDEDSATGAAAGLALLASHGVTMTRPEPITFATDRPAATLAALSAVEKGWHEGEPHAEVAAHIAWTLDRADFPNAGAVVDVLAACRVRYALGVAPKAERDIAVWRAWFGVRDDAMPSILTLLDHATADEPLSGLAALAEDDTYTWTRAATNYTEGRDWRTPESTARAALGLRSRCDAADLHAAALLGDPLHRRAATHSGHVTVGTASGIEGKRKTLTLTSARLDSRLRAGETIRGRIGGPTSQRPIFTGTVRDSGVQDGQLAVLIDGVTGEVPTAGDLISVHTAPPNEHAQRRGRGSMGRLYATRRSWLATGRNPSPTRREVPLDVLVAAATDED